MKDEDYHHLLQTLKTWFDALKFLEVDGKKTVDTNQLQEIIGTSMPFILLLLFFIQISFNFEGYDIT